MRRNKSTLLVSFIGMLICFLFALQICSCKTKQVNRVVVIQPLGNFPTSEARSVQKAIDKICPGTVLKSNIPLPQSAYYQPRNRYRADSLIHYLGAFDGSDTVVIGLTEKDISTNKNNIPDWGVMGLGYCPGNACVVSTFRLSKTNLTEQFYKVAIHELGHTQGLPHCKNEYCFMRDAEGGNPLDKEHDFCDKCKQFLIDKGWHFL